MVSLEYLAGFFDGEACIRATLQKSGALSIAVSITQKDSAPLHALRRHFNVGTVALYPKEPPFRHFTFFAYSDNARVILEGLLPYLIVKREEAELALQSFDVERNCWGEVSVEDQEKSRFIERRLRQLKRVPIKPTKGFDFQPEEAWKDNGKYNYETWHDFLRRYYQKTGVCQTCQATGRTDWSYIGDKPGPLAWEQDETKYLEECHSCNCQRIADQDSKILC